MLVFEHIRQIVKLCRPVDREQKLALQADIRALKFGDTVSWEEAADYTLAAYQVPRDSFLIVPRVEVYTVNYTAGASDFGLYEPPPPGTAFWQYTAFSGTTYILTDQTAPVQLLLDSDEFLIFQGGYTATLIGTFAVSPDGDIRSVRTLVYGYLCGAAIVDRIGTNQVLVP